MGFRVHSSDTHLLWQPPLLPQLFAGAVRLGGSGGVESSAGELLLLHIYIA